MIPDDEFPVLPYGGDREANSGWAGSDTSRERAERADADGTTSKRQRQVVGYLLQRGVVGATWTEVARQYHWHHGQASGALSTLHKAGRIARLSIRRDRCKVYVLPMFVADRPTEAPGRNRGTS